MDVYKKCSLHDRRLMSQAGRRLALGARVALRAKYRVRPAWLIKRLSSRLQIMPLIDCRRNINYQPLLKYTPYKLSLGNNKQHNFEKGRNGRGIQVVLFPEVYPVISKATVPVTFGLIGGGPIGGKRRCY